MTLKQLWRFAVLGFIAGTRDFYRPPRWADFRIPRKVEKQKHPEKK